MEIEILFDNPQFIVVNKPSGLLSVPGRGEDKKECVVSQLKKLYPGMIEQPSVHRLDRDTSGIMVFAKTKEAHRNISIQFEKRIVKKSYLGIINGCLKEERGEIILKFRLDPDNRPYQVYDPVQGKEGITQWQKLTDLQIKGESKEGSLILFTPQTGRTHQLRLHSASPLGLAHPIVGDSLYGNGISNNPMRLHAFFLSFIDPTPESEKRLNFSSLPSWKEWMAFSEEQKKKLLSMS